MMSRHDVAQQTGIGVQPVAGRMQGRRRAALLQRSGGAGDAPLRLQRCAARRGTNAAEQPDSQNAAGRGAATVPQRPSARRRPAPLPLNVPALDDGLLSYRFASCHRPPAAPTPSCRTPARRRRAPGRAAAAPSAAPLPPPSLLLLPPRRRRTLAALPVPYRALAAPRALLPYRAPCRRAPGRAAAAPSTSSSLLFGIDARNHGSRSAAAYSLPAAAKPSRT
jgi:hypothetical protein